MKATQTNTYKFTLHGVAFIITASDFEHPEIEAKAIRFFKRGLHVFYQYPSAARRLAHDLHDYQNHGRGIECLCPEAATATAESVAEGAVNRAVLKLAEAGRDYIHDVLAPMGELSLYPEAHEVRDYAARQAIERLRIAAQTPNAISPLFIEEARRILDDADREQQKPASQEGEQEHPDADFYRATIKRLESQISTGSAVAGLTLDANQISQLHSYVFGSIPPSAPADKFRIAPQDCETWGVGLYVWTEAYPQDCHHQLTPAATPPQKGEDEYDLNKLLAEGEGSQ